MKIFCINYCLVLSIVGTVFLIGLAIVLGNEYKYVHIEHKKSGSVTCFIAGGIYAIFPLTIIGKYLFTKYNKNKKLISEEIPLMDLSRDSIQSQLE